MKRLISWLLLAPIYFYRACISPMLPPSCRYTPTCSEYAVEAIKKHGAVKGIILGAWRILRCNPFARGGVDYVPDKFDLFYYKKENKQ